MWPSHWRTSANFKCRLKRYDAAFETFERALRIVEDALGRDHIYSVAILFQYAEAKRNSAHHEEALAAYERTIRILVSEATARIIPVWRLFTGAPRYPAAS